MGIGILLKNLISEKGSNVNEVSTATGVNPSTLYSIIKRDSMSANIQDLYKVAQYLGVSLDYFYDGFEAKEKAPSLSDEAIIEQITERYGGAAGEALSMYVRLDDSDRGEIRGEMRQMLKAEKYSHSEPRMA